MRKAILTVVLFGLLWPETAPEAAPPDASRVRTSRIDSLNRTAFSAFRSRDFRTAEAVARRAWDLCGNATNDVAAGVAAANVAAALTMYGSFREALEWQDRAKAIFVRTENPGVSCCRTATGTPAPSQTFSTNGVSHIPPQSGHRRSSRGSDRLVTYVLRQKGHS